MEPIHIDLRNLSQEHLAQCKSHIGNGTYVSPCVIGTLIPVDRREFADRHPSGYCSVWGLSQDGHMNFPIGQLGDAEGIQSAFDSGDWTEVKRIASKYIGAQRIEAGTAETSARPEGREPVPKGVRPKEPSQ